MKFLSSCAALLLLASQANAAEKLKVVASIKPIHSLVASVMEGAGSPNLLVQSNASPHDFSLKPSHVRLLQNADAVFWVGPDLEAFLPKTLGSVQGAGKSVELSEIKGLKLISFKENEHDHDEHGHEHEEHAHEKGHHDEHKHDHEEHAHKGHEDHDDHDAHKHEDEHHDEAHGHDEHDHGDTDMHVWLDPENAKIMVHAIAAHLSKLQPENAALFKENAEKFDAQIVLVNDNAKKELAGLTGREFVVYHDAYSYFEQRYKLTKHGVVAINPVLKAGAKHLQELKDDITKHGVVCVFSEPQFDAKIVKVLQEGTSLKSAVLDPLGSSLEIGPELYFKLIDDMVISFKSCLS